MRYADRGFDRLPKRVAVYSPLVRFATSLWVMVLVVLAGVRGIRPSHRGVGHRRLPTARWRGDGLRPPTQGRTAAHLPLANSGTPSACFTPASGSQRRP